MTTIEDETVVVTGGAGFVGSHIAEALAPDNEVRILDDFSTGKQANVPDGATVVEGDVRDPTTLVEAMVGADVVFHEAGLVSVPQSVEDPERSHTVNATGTLRLLERARAEGARVVLASSVAIYGQPKRVPIREDHPKRPTSPYGIDKLALDHYARLYAERYGVETVALRYFNVYGPRQSTGAYSGVVSTFLEQARNGDPLTVEGSGEQTRDFVHVNDVVRANLAAARTDHVGEAFNVGTGRSVTIRELAEVVRDVTDADVSVVHTEGREKDVERSRADITRARHLLGYEPQTPLRDGLLGLVEAEAPDAR